ncbi:hypothetical protein GCM10023091_08030 [Ravibacter arvi]|uniref:Galactose mutarotase n=1 Tax=Ravibacter arvi TaxID=2051041 RepID=A0ABP8LRB9_9BACT
MKIFLGIGFACAFFLAGCRPSTFPEATVDNGVISATVLLPDAKNGYYRGARFDWSGVVSKLEYKGHSYFGQWFNEYDPFLHDAIMGPVDEFREPLGYETARPGEDFVKIGVGAIKKPDNAPYQFARKYEITDHGKWDVKTGKEQVVFAQELRTGAGIAYRYEKKIRLVPGQAQLVIGHKLSNTGELPIHTSTYNHNFFMIDREPTGPRLKTIFPFRISASGNGFGEIAHAEGETLTYSRQLEKGENVFSEDLRNDKSQSPRYGFSIENTRTGAGVQVACNRAVDRMVYWACPTTACPEPYLDLSLAAGESTDWEITYTFFVKP